MKYLIGVDLGTSSTKAAIYRTDGTLVAESSADVPLLYPAPGVVEQHLTLGGTWTLADKSELTVSYMHAFSESVTGSSVTSLLGIGGTETLKMHQDSLGIAYGMKF